MAFSGNQNESNYNQRESFSELAEEQREKKDFKDEEKQTELAVLPRQRNKEKSDWLVRTQSL